VDRRSFFKASSAGAIALAVPQAANATINIGSPELYKRLVPELFTPEERPPAYTKAVVIGSGFGGAISSLRLAQAGIPVTVLERGLHWPNHPLRPIFAHEPLPDGRGYWHRRRAKLLTGFTVFFDDFAGVFDICEYPNIDVWRAACVGGGSVVFTGVMIAPERRYFDALFGGLVSYDEMQRIYYPRVRSMLRLDAMPADIYNARSFGHSRAWDMQVRKAGYQTASNDGIWNWDVVRAELNWKSRASCIVGESNLGNSNGAKYDLNQNYLKLAQASGNAKIYASQQVLDISYDGRRYKLDVARLDHAGRQVERYVLSCDYLFLGAGSIGTSELLVRAHAKGTLRNLNEHIGQGWGTNGDAIAVRSFAQWDGLTQGAASASRIHDTKRMPTTLENWYVPGLRLNLGMLGSLAMGFDTANRGHFAYNPGTDKVDLRWAADGNADAVAAAREINNRIAHATNTIPGAWPFSPDVHASFTAHPLGGAVLGRATDAYGRVAGHPRLYVMDGAMIPGSTGAVNPSLTISALAERNVERIIKEDF
jgi:cholesterol oxidase